MTGIDKDIKRWVDLSDYDFETAHSMLKGGRYLYVLFCCQQALEKRLKALIVKTTESFPLRTHDLLRLAATAQLVLNDDQSQFLRRMTNYYIGTRYPEEVNRLATGITNQLAKDNFNRTKEMVKWLDNLLK